MIALFRGNHLFHKNVFKTLVRFQNDEVIQLSMQDDSKVLDYILKNSNNAKVLNDSINNTYKTQPSAFNLDAISLIFQTCSERRFLLEPHLIGSFSNHIQQIPQKSLGPQNLSSICLSLKDYRFEQAQIPQLISTLTSSISNCNEPFTSKHIIQIIIGLKNMDFSKSEIQEYIDKLSSKLTPGLTFSIQDIGNIMSVFNEIQASNHSAQRLISLLSQRIFTCPHSITIQDCAMAFFGLNQLSCKDKSVRLILSQLTLQLKICPSELDDKSLNSILFSLQKMQSSTPEVLDLLKVLSVKIRSSPSLLSPSFKLTNGLFGLQLMQADSQEMRDLLSSLNDCIDYSSEPWSQRTIASSLYGLKMMTDQSKEVRRLLETLTQKIQSSSEVFDTRVVGMGLFGLQGMRSESSEVKGLLRALIIKINQSPPFLMIPQNICNALYGLKMMILNNFKGKSTPQSSSSLSMSISENFTDSDPPFSITSDSFQEVKILLEFLCSKLSTCRQRFTPYEFSQLIYSLPNSLQNLIHSPHHSMDIFTITNSNISDSSSPFFQSELTSLLSEITIKLQQSVREIGTFQVKHLAKLFYGLRGLSSSERVVRGFLSSLLPILRQNPYPNANSIQSPHVGMLLFGLQAMSSSEREVLALLPLLTHSISTCCSPFTSKSFSMSLYGLQNLDTKFKEVRGLLSALSEKLSYRDMPPSPALVNAFQSLPPPVPLPSTFNSISPNHTSPLVDSLPLHSLISFPPKSIALSLYGLSSFSKHSQEVEKLLGIICDNIESSLEYLCLLRTSTPFTHSPSPISPPSSPSPSSPSSPLWTFEPFHLSRALYGIQTMNPDSLQTRRLLRLLAPSVCSCPPSTLDARDVGNALYGLIGLSLHDLSRKNTHSQIFQEDIQGTDKGLKKVTSNAHHEFLWKVFLQGLFSRVNELASTAPVSSLMFLHQSILLISSQNREKWRTPLFSSPSSPTHLSPSSSLSSSNPPSPSPSSPSPLTPLYRSLIDFDLENEFWFAERSIRKRIESEQDEQSPPSPVPPPHFTDHKLHPFPHSLPTQTQPPINNNNISNPNRLPSPSPSPSPPSRIGMNFNFEKKTLEGIFSLLARMAYRDNPSVQVLCSPLLYGFQADILLKIRLSPSSPSLFPSPSTSPPFLSSPSPLKDSYKLLNIEIDGPHHGRARKARFCGLRDAYLLHSHRIQTLRVDVMAREGPWWSLRERGSGPLDEQERAVAWFLSLTQENDSSKRPEITVR